MKPNVFSMNTLAELGDKEKNYKQPDSHTHHNTWHHPHQHTHRLTERERITQPNTCLHSLTHSLLMEGKRRGRSVCKTPHRFFLSLLLMSTYIINPPRFFKYLVLVLLHQSIVCTLLKNRHWLEMLKHCIEAPKTQFLFPSPTSLCFLCVCVHHDHV